MSLGIQKTFNLDMVPGGAPPIIHVSAEDVGRPYRINLLYNGEVYEAQGNRLTIAGTKPDGTVFEYPVDDFERDESYADFTIKEQMAIVPGMVRCKLWEYLNDEKIGSATFILDVDEYVYDPEAASESYIPTYETAIQEALETVADDIADLATAAAINDVKQYSDAASESATAAAESAANAFSGTPEGYNTLVASVGELTGNDGNFAIQAFPKATINSAVDLNNIYIGDYACKNTSYLTNAPTGLTVPVRITVFARTRDGLTDPDALSNTMHRTQTIVDAAGKEYSRQMKRLGGGEVTWTDWKQGGSGLFFLNETYNQENENVQTYLTYLASHPYSPNDYSTSYMTTLISGGLDTDYTPGGASVTLDAGTLCVTDNSSHTSTERAVASGSNTINNVTPGAVGTFTVRDSNNDIKSGGTLRPTGKVRFLDVPYVENCRDLGGWTCDGGTVKYNKLIRGADARDGQTELNTYTAQLEQTRNVLVNGCGVRHELNLRGGEDGQTVSFLGSDISFTYPANFPWYSLVDNGGGTVYWKQILDDVISHVTNNNPVFFHCSAGYDRTGTVACILEAILGVSQPDCDMDYELSQNNYRVRTSDGDNPPQTNWKGLMTEIAALPGATFRDKVISWAVGTVGITVTAINNFRKTMSTGTPALVRTVTKTLTNCTGTMPSAVVVGSSFSGTVTASTGYTLTGATVSVTMGGTDITSTAYDDGTISISNVTGAVVVSVTAAQDEPPWSEDASNIAIGVRQNWDGNVGAAAAVNSDNTRMAVGTSTSSGASYASRESTTYYMLQIPTKATKAIVTLSDSTPTGLTYQFMLCHVSGSSNIIDAKTSYQASNTYEFDRGNSTHIGIVISRTDASWAWGYSAANVTVTFRNY